MPLADISGVQLNYVVTGQGKAVVFLHGYTGSTQDWANQVPFLASKYQVIALDNRGHGRSAAPSTEEEYSIPLFADDVFGLLQILDVGKCCLVGHSMGGFIALEFALKHPDMLAGLVLVDTSSGQFARDPGYVQLRQKLDELARSQGVAAAFEYDLANYPPRIERFQKHPELKEVSLQRMLMTSVDGYIYASRAIRKWEPVTSRLSEIRVPTLIYWGDEDSPFAEAVHTLKRGITGSELITIKGVGHSPQEEAPELFNETLLKFLRRIRWNDS